MSKDAAEVLKDALSLPAEARAALVHSLLESLDTELDKGTEEAWRQEIQKRVAEIDSGAVELIPWEEIERRVRARIRR